MRRAGDRRDKAGKAVLARPGGHVKILLMPELFKLQYFQRERKNNTPGCLDWGSGWASCFHAGCKGPGKAIPFKSAELLGSWEPSMAPPDSGIRGGVPLQAGPASSLGSNTG